MSQLNSLSFHDITSLRMVESPTCPEVTQALCDLWSLCSALCPSGIFLCQAFWSLILHKSKLVFRQRPKRFSCIFLKLLFCSVLLSRTLPHTFQPPQKPKHQYLFPLLGKASVSCLGFLYPAGPL